MNKSKAKILKSSKKLIVGDINLPCTFPIVAIGASAGGLETFSQLLKALPADSGMAFVLIQHLDPNHASLLTEVLAKTTKMPVVEIKDGMIIKPDHVHVIPAGSDIGILSGVFSLFPREKTRKPHLSIDFFFRALAADCGSRAIGVVLSGTANDGTEGLRAIKNENGVTLTQDPKTAKFEGMPQSAINAQVVDFSLSIPKLAKELLHLSKQPFSSGKIIDPLSDPQDVLDLQKVFVLLRTNTNIDFSEYKSTTIRRRLIRRMVLLKIETLSNYIKFLLDKPEEIKALAADVLIHVTSFFRDPDVFRDLQSSVFPEIIKHKAIGSPIRIWIGGCSSGEEVYSIAISLLEYLGERSSKFQIQMFGSDLSEAMIEKARNGFYSESSLSEMSVNRINRFFDKVEGGYKIRRLIRDLCVFVKHDLARDPPFSKLDMITCRNVLIYFEQALQKRIISTFHYCLNQPGFLVLGRTENVTNHSELFTAVDVTNKIFSRKSVTSQLRFVTMQSSSNEKQTIRPKTFDVIPPVIDIAKQVDNIILSQYAPAGVLINERMEVLQYRGKTGVYLEPPPGQPQLNILKMVREGLFASLKVALGIAEKKMTVIRKDGLEFKHNKVNRVCNIVVTPITGILDRKEKLFLVLFEEVIVPSKLKKIKTSANKKNKTQDDNKGINAAKLQHELRTTQEYLHSLNEEHQKTNETLNSMNEELVSGNEELQSMNEELETAKEELQSTNEELTTVNDELQERNSETALINDDLVNLLHSVKIPILILDLNRRIRRFTPKAQSIMNLLPTDVGRRIDDIRPNIIVDDLDQHIREVIDTVTTKEFEVQDRKGKWHRLNIRPYKTIDNKIAGAVLSLINVDYLRRAVNDAEWIRDYSASIVEAIQIPLLVLNIKMDIVSTNQAFCERYGFSKKDVEGKNLFALDSIKWDTKILKSMLDDVLKEKNSFRNTEIEWNDLNDCLTALSLSARLAQFHDGNPMILLAIEDITERKKNENEKVALLHQTQEAKVDADKANLTKDLFLATLSHELRTPLTSMILQAQMLRRGTLDEAKAKKASLAIEKAANTQTQLIEDLLDVSRIVTGKLKMEVTSVNLNDVIHAALETVSAIAQSKSINIEPTLDSSVGNVWGDATRLQQIVWNLLTNAIKFSNNGDKVFITLKSIKKFAVIEVIDKGAGISKEFLPFVFNRFTQAEESITRKHGGLGLGLAIVRHLVEMHDGTVAVESLGENKGTTFTVKIPLIEEILNVDESDKPKIKNVTTKSSKRSLATNLSGIKILLVEDDTGAREALTEMLNQAGADVKAAASANEAMEALKTFTPDELLLDIAMPGEDGYSLLGRIRKMPQKNGRIIPALALTALATAKDRENAFAAGFQMHIAKPVDIDRLTGALFDLNEQNHTLH